MIVGIIPARFASTRLYGKPLVDIDGKTMLQRTYESAKNSKLLSEIVIAVDDERVYDEAKKFGAQVEMTPKDLETGSDRIAYVANKLLSAEIIVNIQGDEPFIPGKMIDEAIEPLLFDKNVVVSTLAKKITSLDELNTDTIPKVVLDYDSNALYFSRLPIPYVRDDLNNNEILNKASFYKHIGLYVYRKPTLMQFTSMQPTDLECYEKLEQLRLLENGIPIKVVITERDSISVDTKEDLEFAREYYKKIKSNC